MPNKSKAETDIRITVAAGLFATYTRDAKEIADKLASTVGAEIGIKSGKVREWARIFGWNA